MTNHENQGRHEGSLTQNGTRPSLKQTNETKPNLISAPKIELPKGGGAIRSIEEKFSVNAANGTASFSVALPFSSGRNGQSPSHSLHYNSGSGNGIFGIGWSMDLPVIQRKTEKKLPEYRDAEESDTFIFSGAEDLVPELVQDVNGTWIKHSYKENNANITRYKPRIEGGFARIEKVEDVGNMYWRVRTKDNIVLVFGKSDNSKLYSPVSDENYKIFKWNLEYSYDDTGNVVFYNYKKENSDSINPVLSEKNRLNGIAPFTNIYLKSIKYCNKTAYYEGDALPTDFLMELVFDFGEHDTLKPTTLEKNKWTCRKDPFSDYRAGFEIRTYRLCRRVLMFHHFKNELGWDDYLVRSTEFSYDEQPFMTYLENIVQTGYIWNTDGTLKSKQSLPPVEFNYFKPGFSREVKEISKDNIANAPIGLDSQHYQWIDLYSEGVSGVLSEQDTGWYYKENFGNGEFSSAKLVAPKPSFSGISQGTLSIQDLQADGKKYVVKTDGAIKGYYEMDEEDTWQSFYSFSSYPNIDFKDPNLKYLDLNGDGMPDLLLSHEQDFIWYAAMGKAGYDDYHLVARAGDEERGPKILFADKDEKQLIALADMSGHGLTDIVLLTYAGVSYYPNLGYGKFGAKVTMQMDGCFDNSVDFNLKFVHFIDIDGSGTADIVYTGKNKVQVWFNESGNNLNSPTEFFNPFPETDDQSNISFVDLNANGTSCLVWSSPLPSQSYAPLRYIDIMGGQKPHIMYSYKNNMGKEVMLEYKSSSQYYLEDKKIGKKWVTKLPFPVHCVSKVTVLDKVSQTRLTNEYTYHHGYYDSYEREFRGFAMVEQRDAEEFDNYVQQTQSSGAVNTIEKDLYQPVVYTKSWFHTGAYINRDKKFHQLQDEYYPNALINSGQITDPALIAVLQSYALNEYPFPPDLSGDEYTECCRALKGLPLRTEIYSDEGDVQIQMHPYAVSQHNYDIQIIQHKLDQKYSVFFSHEKEEININFERNPLDPRISQSINIEIDQHGNVLQSAAIVYGRKNEDSSLPTEADRQKQTMQFITYAQNRFTAVIDIASAYRLPVPCETKMWELNAPQAAGTFYQSSELLNIFNNATEKLYEQDTLINEKRKIEHSRTYFLKNDLTGPLNLGYIDTLGLPHQNYLLAFTPTLLQNIYGGKYDESLMRNKGLYVRSEGDNNYWIKSGRTYYHPDLTADPGITSIPAPMAADIAFAKSNFYMPVAYEDNFGNLTKVFYDAYKIHLLRVIDAVGNEMNVDGINYRTIASYLVRDTNDNRGGVRMDELGRVTHTFVMGKEGESKGDFMDTSTPELSTQDQPTTITEYQLRYYTSNGKLPDRVKTSIREMHYYKEAIPTGTSGSFLQRLGNIFSSSDGGTPVLNTNIIWQTNYSYSDGSGHEILKKIQAEPGLAPKRDAQGNLILDAFGKVELADTSPELRWVGNGRTIFNNKGKPVKQYEPFFDSSFEYNDEKELVEIGFTSIIYYDAIGRAIKTEHPNGTFSKVEFDAWMQKAYDENDTVMDSQWYNDRINGAMGEAEQTAAQQAAVHYNTPAITYLDSLGRTFIHMDQNKTQRTGETVQEETTYTRVELDIEGNTHSITDGSGNTVMTWKYDILGHTCYQQSMDAGERWMLTDVMGKSLRSWDSRQQVFSFEYDVLRRPSKLFVNAGSGDILYEQYQYGEGVVNDKQNNLRGKLYKHYDTAGMTTASAYDFKGNNTSGNRQLLKDYKNTPDWKGLPALETEIFATETSFDALSRPIQTIAPDKSIIVPLYNPANLLDAINVSLQGVANVTSFVTNIDYNSKGEREAIYYGNNTATKYDYDLKTYRLTRLLTTANNGNSILQDLNYTYDPAGNITRLFDNAQKTIFYGGQQVEAQSDYIYDALYRLVQANGREHIGQVGYNNGQDNWNDAWSTQSLQPNSPIQMRNYTQKYFYDKVGNISKLQHQAGNPGSWIRTFQYNQGNNQLTKTTVAGQSYEFTYNEHGSMKTMPQLQQLDWNFRENIEHIDLGGGGNVWYVYDSSGQRVRKVIEKLGSKTTERIYLGIFEVYRERTNNNLTLERQTLHISDGKNKVALVETRTHGNDGTAKQLVRYQYSNHIGSACLELDEASRIISYEEYHSFGTSAYKATDSTRQVPPMRYRYTGQERDGESGLNYHNARYYAPWLCRWTSADPIGIEGGINLYAYCKGNPIINSDINGMDPGDDSARLSLTTSGGTVSLGGGLSQASAPPNPDRASYVLGLGRADWDYMGSAEGNTGLWSVNIQDRYNIDRSIRMSRPVRLFFPAGPAMERTFATPSTRSDGGGLYPMFSGIMVQEALEGNQVGTVHADMRGVDLTPRLTSGMPGFSRQDYHSSSEARQVFAHLASTDAGERRVDIVISHSEGVTTIPRTENRVSGAPLPANLAARVPNINNTPRPPRSGGSAPLPRPGGGGGSRGGALAGAAANFVPGATEALMTAEAIVPIAARLGAPRLFAAALAGARAPGPAVVGGIVGAPVGVLAEDAARHAGLGTTASAGVGLGTAVATGAGIAVLGVLAVATAPVTGTVLAGAALVGGLAAGFGYLSSRLFR